MSSSFWWNEMRIMSQRSARAARPQLRGANSRVLQYQPSRVLAGMSLALVGTLLSSQPTAYCMADQSEPEALHAAPPQEEEEEEGEGEQVEGAGEAEECEPGVEAAGEAAMDGIISAVTPIVGRLGFGGVLGWSAGYAAKKFGRLAAVVVGTTFIGLQVLAYNGLIVIPWHVWEERTKKSLDLNKDGKLDAEDAKVALRSATTVLKYGLASSGGFTLGFALGLKHG